MRAPGIVKISQLEVSCVVGIYPGERTKTQPLVVELDLHLDFADAAASENVGHTVDYAKISDDIRRVLIDGKFKLIETAAEAIARHALATSTGPKVERVRVKITKPEAIAPAVAAVEIVRP